MAHSVTIADVARRIGVSKSTVSHALSGKRPISKEVTDKVLRAVEELGYRPNFAARVLNTRSTGLIGVLVDTLNNPHNTVLVESLGREFARHSIRMVLSIEPTAAGGRELIRRFSDGMVDGILNTIPELAEEEARALAGKIPLITYLRHQESCLTVDFAAGLRAAMLHLRDLGHRRIALIPADRRAPGEEDPCLAAYREQCARDGAPPLIFHAEASMEGGLQTAPQVFASGATAVLAGNDAVAAGILQCATLRGLQVPQQLSVIGHDDIPLAALTFPPLTTLRLPVELIARHTVAVMMHAVDRNYPSPPHCRIEPELVIRSSSGRAP